GDYLRWLEEHRGLVFDGYDALWRWSVDDLDGFWSSLWDYFGIAAHAPYERVLSGREMPGAAWFSGSRLNYAEHALRGLDDARPMVLSHSQTRDPAHLTGADLRDQVARARAGLRRLGVQR